MNQRKTNKASWQQLAMPTSSNQNRPDRVALGAAVAPPREPTLTQKFNAAAKKPVLHDVANRPVSKRQIDLLQRQQSQPRATYEMTPLGSVLKARNPDKDRRLLETMTALTERLHRQKGLKQHFAKAANKGLAKRQFNRASKGMGM